MANPGVKATFILRNDHGQSQGAGTARLISVSRALAEAIALWLAIWIFTIPLVFVPIVHLTAVPVGVVGGIVLPIFIFRRRCGRLNISDGSGPCPKCHAPLNVSLENISKETHWGVCLLCQTGFSIPPITMH